VSLDYPNREDWLKVRYTPPHWERGRLVQVLWCARVQKPDGSKLGTYNVGRNAAKRAKRRALFGRGKQHA
jgi:hypothetical protein